MCTTNAATRRLSVTHSDKMSHRSSEKWKRSLKIAAMLLAIVCAIISVLQWRDSRSNFAVTERPAIVVTDVNWNARPGVDLHYANVGRGIARDVGGAGDLRFSTAPSPEVPVGIRSEQFRIIGSFGPGNHGMIWVSGVRPPADVAEDIKRIKQKHLFAYAAGVITYKDVLGNRYEEPYCYMFDADSQTFERCFILGSVIHDFDQAREAEQKLHHEE